MNSTFERLMTQAAALTRNGDLQRATAALQSALSRHGAASGLPPVVPPGVQPVGATPVVPAGLRSAAKAWALGVAGRGAPMSPGSTRDDGTVNAAAAAPAPAPASTSASASADAAERSAAVGARFVAGEFSCSAGRRAYKLYIPPQAGSKPLPLVVMLHGCTQNPDDFAAGTAMNEAAFAQGFFVLYPAQAQDANPQRCWNWFKHNHQQPGRGEPLLLAGMTQHVMATQTVDPRRVYVAGLSAGGAMAAILGDCHPELYAAVGVHSGLAAGAASDLPSALAAMRNGAPVAAAERPEHRERQSAPTIVFHGSADTTVHPANAEQAALAGVAGGGGDSVVMDMPAAPGRRAVTRQLYRRRDGSVASELWLVDGAPHAWSGGSAAGSYTDPKGPDASAEMLRFFFERAQP